MLVGLSTAVKYLCSVTKTYKVKLNVPCVFINVYQMQYGDIFKMVQVLSSEIKSHQGIIINRSEIMMRGNHAPQYQRWRLFY